MDFIEVTRIVTNKDGSQKTVPETMKVGEIKTFRPWYKSAKDKFEGDATLVVLYNKSKVTGHENEAKEEESNYHTMLIAESYSSLRDRLKGRVIIVVNETAGNIQRK